MSNTGSDTLYLQKLIELRDKIKQGNAIIAQEINRVRARMTKREALGHKPQAERVIICARQGCDKTRTTKISATKYCSAVCRNKVNWKRHGHKYRK